MEVIVFESEAYYKMLFEQSKIIKQAIIDAQKEATKRVSPSDDFLTLEEAQRILPFKSKTKWQNLRNSGEIEYVNFGRKIKYGRVSLLKYQEKYKVKPF